MSLVGSSRICGYSKMEPRAVKPAMARTAARASDAAARRALVRLGVGMVMVCSWRSRSSAGSDGRAVAIPGESGGKRFAGGCGSGAEGGAELGVVDDPGAGELVEGVQVLPHLGFE